MTYRGYVTSLELVPNDNLPVGRVPDIDDLITFRRNRQAAKAIYRCSDYATRLTAGNK